MNFVNDLSESLAPEPSRVPFTKSSSRLVAHGALSREERSEASAFFRSIRITFVSVTTSARKPHRQSSLSDPTAVVIGIADSER